MIWITRSSDLHSDNIITTTTTTTTTVLVYYYYYYCELFVDIVHYVVVYPVGYASGDLDVRTTVINSQN